jgi:uncharacterized PurR-regulated membrane protein YhhQ (DUF165 family)
MKQYRFFDLIMAVFVTVLVVSNIASSAKIVDWGHNLFGLPLAFDAGTILFPISYIERAHLLDRPCVARRNDMARLCR